MTTRHTQANAVRVLSGAALPKDGARSVAPNGAAYDQRFIASTELLASDGGVIRLDAWRLGGWLARPRWIANHDLWADSGLGQATLGRGVYAAIEGGLDPARVGPSGRALVVYVRYASTPVAQEVRMLYEEGGLDDVSVRWDWQTEETRAPFEEEVLQYGEGLAWVCTRADLVEVSAVLLGADAGAQIVRGNVVAAVERCVRRGRSLPRLTSLIRGDALPDPMASADALDLANTAVGTLADLHDAASMPRSQLGDALTALGNLVSASTTDAEPGAAAVAFAAVGTAVSSLDLAQRDVGPAITALREAVAQLAKALALDDRAIDVDLAACLADRGAATITSVQDYFAAIATAAAKLPKKPSAPPTVVEPTAPPKPKTKSAPDEILVDLDAVLADARLADSTVVERLFAAYKAMDA